MICRFHAFLLFLGHPAYAVREVSIHRFCKILSEFALEYRTTRERVLQQKQKRANHRERNKTRGKMITDVSAPSNGFNHGTLFSSTHLPLGGAVHHEANQTIYLFFLVTAVSKIYSKQKHPTLF